MTIKIQKRATSHQFTLFLIKNNKCKVKNTCMYSNDFSKFLETFEKHNFFQFKNYEHILRNRITNIKWGNIEIWKGFTFKFVQRFLPSFHCKFLYFLKVSMPLHCWSTIRKHSKDLQQHFYRIRKKDAVLKKPLQFVYKKKRN